jgi:hypothetical protein
MYARFRARTIETQLCRADADNGSMRADERADVVLYLWDYFYLSNHPEPGDEKRWGTIERATCRIRECEIDLDPPKPVDVRLRSARRMRAAVRVALRNIERLSTPPERWVIDRLVELERLANDLIETLNAAAHDLVLH